MIPRLTLLSEAGADHLTPSFELGARIMPETLGGVKTRGRPTLPTASWRTRRLRFFLMATTEAVIRHPSALHLALLVTCLSIAELPHNSARYGGTGGHSVEHCGV